MTENAPEAPTAPAADEPKPNESPEAPKADDTDWKAEARKWEQRAKENRQAATELEKQRQATMTESEKAIAEAEARGRTSAATEYGTRLARSEFDALAGRRNAEFDTSAALEFVDLTKFLTEDGDLNSKAIQAAVERLVPQGSTAPPSFDGGSRTPPPAQQGMSQIIRKAAGRA